MYAWLVYKHAVVAAFPKARLDAIHQIVMEITLLIMEKSWDCVLIFCGNPDPDQLASVIWIYIVFKTKYILI